MHTRVEYILLIDTVGAVWVKDLVSLQPGKAHLNVDALSNVSFLLLKEIVSKTRLIPENRAYGTVSEKNQCD